MSTISDTDELFFNRIGLDRRRLDAIVGEALSGADDGELFLEYRQSESMVLDDGCLKSAAFDTSQGFGLRAVAGEATGYAHATDLTEEAIRRAGEAVAAVCRGRSGVVSLAPVGTNRSLYTADNPLALVPFETKTRLLADIDAYARGKDGRVRQVIASLAGEWQAVHVQRSGGEHAADIRPLVRLNVSVVVEQDGRKETGSHGTGGRITYEHLLEEATWRGAVDEALRQALVNLQSVPAPAGEMTVVLGPGWPGILLHEAIGHGLEGDFNRKKTSAFAGLVGQRVASAGVTVVDDGTISDRRGSLTIDDEGTPSQSTVLIEDGILVGFMQDRQNARLMGVKPTGNGRRESFAHIPMPRMTNTYMLAGQDDPASVLADLKDGIWAVGFGGGQVDITSGKFVFSCTEAYRVRNGQVGEAIRGATLIGDGATALKGIRAIGNDLKLDPGIGNCGKAGQWVPVGVGQPTLMIGGLAVGGQKAG